MGSRKSVDPEGSGQGNVAVFPDRHRRYRPNIDLCFAMVDMVKPQGTAELVTLAGFALRSAEEQLAQEPDPVDCQAIVDSLGVAFFSLATILGVPRSDDV